MFSASEIRALIYPRFVGKFVPMTSSLFRPTRKKKWQRSSKPYTERSFYNTKRLAICFPTNEALPLVGGQEITTVALLCTDISIYTRTSVRAFACNS